MSNSKILITGAQGKIGRRLVAQLRVSGHDVTAASRTSSTRFDWHDQSTWDAAIADAQALFLVAPEQPADVSGFVRRAVEAGVQHVVAMSGRRIRELSSDFGDNPMLVANDAARESGVEWTGLEANNFHQNFDEGQHLDELRSGVLTLPMGDGHPEPFIDTEDIAAVAAEVLTQPGHAGQVYELTGARGVTYREAIEIIARANGHDIRYQEVTPAEYTDFLRAADVPAEFVEFLDRMYSVMRKGFIAAPADGVRRVLGRDPITFEKFAARAAAAGAWD